MFCSKCGNKLDANSKFCSKCGSQNIGYSPPNTVNVSTNNTTNTTVNTNKKRVNYLKIIIPILVVVLVIGFSVFATLKSKNHTRTVMIYMVGANLESDAGLGTVDLSSIDYNRMDNEHVNVVLIAGGSKSWKNNYIDANETSIFELTSSGFQEVKEQSIQNMGDEEVFRNYLDYVYSNYHSDRYDLIMWDHGGAIDGSEYDELSNDNLSLREMEAALSKSSFARNKKLELVIFRTCLNGSLEMANVYKDYADYLVASEEITLGSPQSTMFSFINNIEYDSTPQEIGRDFIEGYKSFITSLNYVGDVYSTYSLIDLNKIDKVNKNLNNFSNDINVDTDFNTIAKVRANLLQYGSEAPSYDMVDLQMFITGIRDISSSKADKLINSIYDAVIYSWSTDDRSNGLSIYFPYNGSSGFQSEFLNLYKDFDDLGGYYNLIKNFNTKQLSSYGSKAYDFSANDTKVSEIEDNKADFEVELTDEQVKTFAKAKYIVFADAPQEENSQQVVYVGNISKLDGNTLKASITGRQLEVRDKSDPDFKGYSLALVESDETDEYIKYSSSIILEDFRDSKFVMDGADINFSLNKKTNKIDVEGIYRKDFDENKNRLPNTVLLNPKNYQYIAYASSDYHIFDENGEFLGDWEKTGVVEGYEIEVQNVEYKLDDFNSSSNYYCVFVIYDTSNNAYYSKLVYMR